MEYINTHLSCSYCLGTGYVEVGYPAHVDNGMIVDEVSEKKTCLCQMGECDCQVCEAKRNT